MTTLAAIADSVSSTLGTTWWSILCFIAGALIGPPLWEFIKGLLPWKKK